MRLHRATCLPDPVERHGVRPSRSVGDLKRSRGAQRILTDISISWNYSKYEAVVPAGGILFREIDEIDEIDDPYMRHDTTGEATAIKPTRLKSGNAHQFDQRIPVA
jgi:hypothetical protein